MLKTLITLGFSALLVGSLTLGSASAHPDQLWEDYILAPDAQAWVSSLPEASAQRRYFEILSAQVRGDLKRAAALLKSAERSGEFPADLVQLKTRQQLLALTTSSSKDEWEAVARIAHIKLSKAPYQTPVRQTSSGVKETTTRDVTRAESHVSRHELTEALEHERAQWAVSDMTILGRVNAFLGERWSAPLSPTQEKRLLRLLKTISYFPLEKPLSSLRSLHPKRLTSSVIDKLSDLELKGLISEYKLDNALHRELFEKLLKRSRLKVFGARLYKLDAETLDAYLTRLKALDTLAPRPRSDYLAHLALAELSVAERRGEWPLKPLLMYLALPHDTQHYHRIYTASLSSQQVWPAEPVAHKHTHPEWIHEERSQMYRSLTGFTLSEPPSVVVARHIEHHLERHRDIRRFSDYIDVSLLYKMWAKRSILEGGDLKNEKLQEYLRSDDARRLRELKLLRFAPLQTKTFKRDQEVELTLRVKGYKTLEVQIYQLNMSAYIKQDLDEVPLTIDLSGLEANTTRHLELERPERLSTPTLKLPELSAPGTYIVDIRADAEKIRVLVRKGHLTPYLIETAAGPELVVIDDLGHLAQDFKLTIDGRAYQPKASGHVRLPYRSSKQRGPSDVVITRGGLTTQSKITLPTESYKLKLNTLAPQLKGGAANSILVRAHLFLNGRAIPIALLKQATLMFNVTGRDGTLLSKVISQPEFDYAGELTVPLQLPLGFKRLELKLTGELERMTDGERLSLRAETKRITRNSDIASVNVADVVFVRGATPPRVEVIGRNGEPLRGARVRLTFTSYDTHKHDLVTLQKRADARGAITLPQDLSAIRSISAQVKLDESDRARTHTWRLRRFAQTRKFTHQGQAFTLRAETPVSLMWPGSTRVHLQDAISRRPLRGAVKVEDGILQLSPLKPGDYTLVDVGEQSVIKLSVFGEGATLHGDLWLSGHAVTPHHPFPQTLLKPLQITTPSHTSGAPTDTSLKITVERPTPLTRLHIIATPYALDGDLKIHHSTSQSLGERLTLISPESAYGVGQVLSEEMRYILKRQSAPSQIGNLATSPSLLLNRLDYGEAQSVDRTMSEGVGLGYSGSGLGGGSWVWRLWA